MKKIMTLALVCFTMMAGLTACGDDGFNKENKPQGELDAALIGTWVFDHCNGYVAPGENKAKWVFYNNGVCQYSDVAAPISYFYTASNGRLITDLGDGRTQVRYYTLKDGLLAIYMDPNINLDETTWFKKGQ